MDILKIAVSNAKASTGFGEAVKLLSGQLTDPSLFLKKHGFMNLRYDQTTGDVYGFLRPMPIDVNNIPELEKDFITARNRLYAAKILKRAFYEGKGGVQFSSEGWEYMMIDPDYIVKELQNAGFRARHWTYQADGSMGPYGPATLHIDYSDK